MRRASPYLSSLSFGPGRLSSAIKVLIAANVLVFFAQVLVPAITEVFGLVPARVVGGLWIWQLGTYMFLHSPTSIFHIVFNMLALWMFGTELEEIWGTRRFLRFYFTVGVGAGLLTVLFSLLPFGFTGQLYRSDVIGASGAVYGLLLAYALHFPERPILLLVFPVPARICVLILGLIAFYLSIAPGSGGVANATHLGGLLVAYLYLRGGRSNPLAELKYQYLRWKINRVRKKFDVYAGGRSTDRDRRVH